VTVPTQSASNGRDPGTGLASGATIYPRARVTVGAAHGGPARARVGPGAASEGSTRAASAPASRVECGRKGLSRSRGTRCSAFRGAERRTRAAALRFRGGRLGGDRRCMTSVPRNPRRLKVGQHGSAKRCARRVSFPRDVLTRATVRARGCAPSDATGRDPPRRAEWRPLAEGEGFEPSDPVNPGLRFSRPVHWARNPARGAKQSHGGKARGKETTVIAARPFPALAPGGRHRGGRAPVRARLGGCGCSGAG
jgi:hypothetical protein